MIDPRTQSRLLAGWVRGSAPRAEESDAAGLPAELHSVSCLPDANISRVTAPPFLPIVSR